MARAEAGALPLCPWGADGRGKAPRPLERVAEPTGGRKQWPGSPAASGGTPARRRTSAAVTGPLVAALPGRTVATQRARAISRSPLSHAGGWHARTRRVARQRDGVAAL